MKIMFLALAALLVASGCVSSSKTTSRGFPATDQTQTAWNSSSSNGSGEWASEPAGQGASAIDHGSAVLTERGGAEALDTSNLELRREELVVGKREVSNGGVLLRTIVQTNAISQPVSLRREEYVIDRIPASQVQDKEALTRNASEAFQSREIFIPLRREESVASKRALLTEQVRLAKRVETDRVTVTRPVRSEDVEIIKLSGQPLANPNAILESGAALANSGRTENANRDTLSLAREELVIGKREVDNGSVRLRKTIRTQDSSQPVELQREEYTIDRVSMGNRVTDNAGFAPREIQASLTRQEPVAEVRNFVTEVIRVRKIVETDNQVVSASLRQETLDIIKNPSAPDSAMGATGASAVSGVTSTTESGMASAARQETSGDLSITQRVQALWSGNAGTTNSTIWMGNESFLRKGIDVRMPHDVSPYAPAADAELMNSSIAVTTVNGVVTLRGNVPSETEKQLIGQQVAAVQGVRSVINELRVAKKNIPASRGSGAELLQNGTF